MRQRNGAVLDMVDEQKLAALGAIGQVLDVDAVVRRAAEEVLIEREHFQFDAGVRALERLRQFLIGLADRVVQRAFQLITGVPGTGRSQCARYDDDANRYTC